MTTSSTLAILAPVLMSLTLIVLLLIRFKSSAVTMLDCSLVMLTIGTYALTQLLSLYFKQSDLKQSLASSTISAFFDIDPTNKVKTMFRDSISDMKAADFAAQKDQIDNRNKAVLLGSGAFIFAVMACGFGVLTLFYHMAFEKRKPSDISSTCEVCVFCIQILGSLGFATFINFALVGRSMCLHNEEAVNSCLNGIKQGLSFNLIKLWNSNESLRNNLRQVPDVSKTVDTLSSSLASVANDTQILSSSLSGVASDVKSSLQKILSELSSLLESLKKDLVAVRQSPCDSGVSSTSNPTNMQHLKGLAVIASRIANFETGKADVDVLVQNLWKSCQPLVTGLKDLSLVNLCDNYQTTRDILLKLEKYCAAETPDSSLVRRISDNLNIFVTTFIGIVALAFGGARLLSGNMKTMFQLMLTTAIALCVYQIFIVDCAAAFGSTVDDWRLLLYGALSF